MINILHTIDTTGPGGAETVFINLITKLDKSKFNPTIVIQGPGWVQETLINKGFTPIIVESKGAFDLLYLFRLLKIIFKYKINIIQAHLFGSIVYSSLIGILTRIPVVATLHGTVDINPKDPKIGIKVFIINNGVKKIIMVSESLASNVKQAANLNSSLIEVIYNGVDLNHFYANKNLGIRREININDSDFLVTSIGNIRPAKGYEYLIRAASLLVKKIPNLHFIIAGQGDGSLKKEFEDLIINLGLEEHFRFIGFRSDVNEILNASDLFVLSSITEGFSISTVEAMAGKVPVIVTRSGGPEEIIDSDKIGILVNPGSELELAIAIEEAFNNYDVSKERVTHAYHKVKVCYSLEAMIQKYEDVYLTLI